MSETHPKGSVGRDSLPLRCWVSVVEGHAVRAKRCECVWNGSAIKGYSPVL